VSIFSFFKKKNTAPVARERLQLLLAHERVAGSDNRLVAILQEEILAVIARHMQIDRDKVRVKLGRDDEVNTLEIDIEMPARTPGRLAARA
jgi:cell division topological specificity factor